MSVREYINRLEPEKVLNGHYHFKVQSPVEKWSFWCDQTNRVCKTVDEFCNGEGIVGCMNLEIAETDAIGEDGEIFIVCK